MAAAANAASAAASAKRLSPLLKSQYRTLRRWTRRPDVAAVPFVFEPQHDLSPETHRLMNAVLGDEMTGHLMKLRVFGGAPAVLQVTNRLFRLPSPTAEEGDKVQSTTAASTLLFSVMRDLEHESVQRALKDVITKREDVQKAVAANGGISPVPFRLGTVVKHRRFHYRGVVAGWDARPAVDVSQWDGVQGPLHVGANTVLLVLS